MANVETYKWSAMKSIIEEATREASHYKNNVDPERTPNNYSLIEGAETREQVVQKVRDRVEEVMGRDIRKQVKANMKPFGCWVIHLPIELNGLSDEEKRDFFETSLDFLKDRYGEENIVMATVHMDEGRPHMHAGIVPVGTSRKTGKQTVSKASVFTMTDLRTFHDDLDAIMAEKYGQAKLIHNERTKGNYTVAELKERQRVQAELDAQKEEIATAKAEIEQVQWDIVNTVGPYKKRVDAQAEQNQKDKQANEQYRDKLMAYQNKLKQWQADQVQALANRNDAVKARESELDEREEQLQVREAEVAQKAQEASERLSEARETLAEANDKLEEVKATESRIKRLLERLNETKEAVLETVKETVSKWTKRVRRVQPNQEALDIYREETDELKAGLDDIKDHMEDHEDFAQSVQDLAQDYDQHMGDRLGL